MPARAAIRLLCFALASLWLAQAPSARAQHGILPPEDRPLHERLAAARFVAIATVAEVGVGRIAFEAPTPILGRLEGAFELKRSPSKPPPFVVGDRALLLLAGARSPYVWVDRPAEALAIDDPADEARVVAALRELDAVRVDPRARSEVYSRWSDGSDEALAALGLRGLMDVPGMAGVLDGEFARERARVATDPERPLVVRRRAARVAVRHADGVGALLDHLERTRPATDFEITELALQAGLLGQHPDVESALVSLLEDPTGKLGRLALDLSAHAKGPAIERRLSELAVGHPDAEVRDEAVHALQRLRRPRQARAGGPKAPAE